MRFSLIDRIGIPAELPRIREALEEHSGQVAASWGFARPSVGIGASHDGSEVMVYLDRSIDVAGAEGYHDEDAGGGQFIKVALDTVPGGHILSDPRGRGGSLLGVLEHEVGETQGDPTADVWRQQPFTDPRTSRLFSLVAQELFDPTQEIADSMTLSDGTVVDRVAWVLPAWFDARRSASRQVDSHGALSAPLTLAPGGYQIVARCTGESDVFAEMIEHDQRLAEWRRAAKKQLRSRTARRLQAFRV